MLANMLYHPPIGMSIISRIYKFLVEGVLILLYQSAFWSNCDNTVQLYDGCLR